MAESLLPEFDQEMDATRRVLERVPADKLGWGPHEKSMTLGRLATHLAELPGWCEVMLNESEFDIAPPGGQQYTPKAADSTADILALFDDNRKKAREMLAAMSDGDLMRPWTLKRGGEDLFTAPRIGVFRRNLLNHVIHHRGQLTVYLRLTGVPVPQTFGPTADEPTF